MGAWGWWMMIGMGLGPLLWFGILILIALLPFHAVRTRHDQTPPLEVLKDRYARGEIDREEFQQAKRELV